MILGHYQYGKTTRASMILEGFPRYWVFDPTFAFPGGTQDLRTAIQQFHETGRAIYQPGRENIAEKFAAWCEIALRLSNCMSFVDEPTMVVGTRSLPQAFSDLMRLGHKRGVGVMIATHRFHGDLPALCRAVHHIFAFRMPIDIDVQALRDYIGDDGATWVKGAPKYHFWYWNGDSAGGPHDPNGNPIRLLTEP